MRQIKFRLWAELEDEHGNNNMRMLNHDDLTHWTVEDLLDTDSKDVLMQSTGLRDKEGKEIFEGDMFNIEDQELPIKLPKSEKGIYAVVVWDEKWGGWQLKVKEIGDFNIHFARENLIVRGNIYENSDLLS